MKAFRLQLLKLFGYTLFVFSVLILGSNAFYVFSASSEITTCFPFLIC
jgi:hypothetical protein